MSAASREKSFPGFPARVEVGIAPTARAMHIESANIQRILVFIFLPPEKDEFEAASTSWLPPNGWFQRQRRGKQDSFA